MAVGLPPGRWIAEQVFSALADPTRRAILVTLGAPGPATATATDLALRLPTISVKETTRPTSVRWTVIDCPFLPD